MGRGLQKLDIERVDGISPLSSARRRASAQARLEACITTGAANAVREHGGAVPRGLARVHSAFGGTRSAGVPNAEARVRELAERTAVRGDR